MLGILDGILCTLHGLLRLLRNVLDRLLGLLLHILYGFVRLIGELLRLLGDLRDSLLCLVSGAGKCAGDIRDRCLWRSGGGSCKR